MSREITVEGMHCGHCEETVEDALRDVEGVESVDADNETGTVAIDGDADDDELASAIDEAGYRAAI